MEQSRLDVNMQDGLLAAAEGASQSNYLGDANLVERLVRDFFVRVFSERAKFHQSGDGDAAEKAIDDACRRYAKVFMGESNAYVAQPWNSPHRLGNYLRAVVPDVGDYETPAIAYFHFLAVQALNASLAIESGQVSEAEVQASLTEVVHDAVDVLLGRKVGA